MAGEAGAISCDRVVRLAVRSFSTLVSRWCEDLWVAACCFFGTLVIFSISSMRYLQHRLSFRFPRYSIYNARRGFSLRYHMLYVRFPRCYIYARTGVLHCFDVFVILGPFSFFICFQIFVMFSSILALCWRLGQPEKCTAAAAVR